MARRRRSSYSYFGEPARASVRAPTQDRLQDRLGRAPTPVRGEGRKLAATFWGLAWCRNLEHYHDYANRLPRGRTYLRQGKILDVDIARGRITGLVLGTSLYELEIEISAVEPEHWAAIRKRCTGKLSSAIDLLEGRLPNEVMAAVTQPGFGLFPTPPEIRMRCSCPDWASMCKHLAALLYGVGLRLDSQPELLFTLRGVSHEELVDGAGLAVDSGGNARRIPAAELAEIFGVLIDDALAPSVLPKAVKRSVAKKPRATKPSAKKPVATKPVATKPVATKPVATKPVATKPVATKPTANKFPSNRKWIDADELGAYGLSAADIREWVREGALLAVDGRNDYRVLLEARQRLRALADCSSLDNA